MPLPLLAPLIAGLTGAFSRLIANRVGMWAVSLLGFLGLSWATHSVVMGPFMSQVSSGMGGVSGDIAAWLGVMKMDRYVSIVLSAYTIGTVKRAFLARRAA